jgi:hypothetical protein
MPDADRPIEVPEEWDDEDDIDDDEDEDDAYEDPRNNQDVP